MLCSDFPDGTLGLWKYVYMGAAEGKRQAAGKNTFSGVAGGISDCHVWRAFADQLSAGIKYAAVIYDLGSVRMRTAK